VPLVELPTWAIVAANVVAWGTIHAATGYAVHRWPTERLAADGWLWRARSVERDGRRYERWLRIRRWKDRVPEAGALFPGGVSKRRLPALADGGLERVVVETRRAELGHWLALVLGPVAVVWNPPVGVVLMVAYGVVANLPFIAIQRYNRLRAQRVLDLGTARSSGSRRPPPSRPSPRRSGSSMP
jgi:glycosyl-4,4'-diaponeurosporenoate acyltransferase